MDRSLGPAPLTNPNAGPFRCDSSSRPVAQHKEPGNEPRPRPMRCAMLRPSIRTTQVGKPDAWLENTVIT
jgi:hypothetical protein